MNLKRRARELAEALENVHFRKFDPKENRWEEVNVLILAAFEPVQAETRRLTLEWAADICREQIRHAKSHAGDPRYGGRADGASACELEIRAFIAEPAPPDPLLVARLRQRFAEMHLNGCETLEGGGHIEACVGRCDCREFAKAAIALAEGR